MAVEVWKYETRCRVCRNIAAWFFADRKDCTQKDFISWVMEKINFASPYPCSYCNRTTVHDIISFDD